ncbi:hypothetical protein Taro_038630 [Colocasia esculenta]|uniref:Ubiquitin-like protease family profile domain-containing protein n=1 Tax=Colocasia esculenta TaxID=4460 RepID=A0A843WT81_COLES|nr:hypothetical protein [Colocasia esculenta]
MLICLDNIDEVGRYNWVAAVTEMTLHKFDDFVTIVREKRSGRNTTPKRRIAGREHGSANIFGCSAALAVWFLEHTRLRQPIDREAIPRLFRWGSVLDKKLSFSIDSLQGQQVIDIVLHAMKVRQREQEALILNSYHRWEFLGTILGSWIMHTDGSDDDRGHKLHTSLGHENLGCPISDFQFLFFVVHVSNHWFLLSLQLEQCRIVVYNSCRGHPTYDTCARKWEPILKAYL